MYSLSCCWTLCAFTLTASVLGRVVKEELTLTWEVGRPNGQAREMIKMNGQFPGPALIWDEDDDIEITVHNQMPFNTSVHWHGLMMQGTPWSDGAPGLTQKPIEIGESFIYRFKAYPAGTHWYHSHTRTTLLDGLYGAIFIRPNPDAPAPWSLISNNSDDIEAMERAVLSPQLIVVSDWSNFKSWEYMEAEAASSLAIFCVDSLLINGKGSLYCPGEEFLVNHSTNFMKWALYPGHVNDKGCFPFMKSTEGPYLAASKPETIPLHLQKGCVPASGDRAMIDVDPAEKWVSLNFIGAATFKTTIFSIDEHQMWVYEVDGEYIEPQLVDTVNMYAGERYSAMIKLDKKPRDYTIRVSDNGLTQVISSYATLRYQGGFNLGETQGVLNYGGQNTTTVVTLDRKHLPPFPPNAPAAHSDAHHLLYTHRWFSPWQYTMSGGGMYHEDRSAYTPLMYEPNSHDAFNDSLIIRTKNGTWVDLIIQVGSLPDQPQEFPHIMHKHTGKTWQISAGEGIWKYKSVDEAIEAEPSSFNLENPNHRDTFITSFDGPSWIVLRYQVTNPGPWLFHCHIETHLAGGMAVAILDGIDAWPEIPPEYAPDQRGFYPITQPGLEVEKVHQALETIDDNDPVLTVSHEQGHQYGDYWLALVRKIMGFLSTLAPTKSS